MKRGLESMPTDSRNSMEPTMLKVFAMAATLLACVPAWAEGSIINERRPLNADAQLVVKNLAGVIEVRGWDRAEIQLSGRLGDDVEKLDISGDADELRIEVRYPRKMRGGVDDTDLHLRVPAGVSLDLEAVSADLRVSGVRGAVKAASVSGDLRLDVGSSRVIASSVSGSVDLRSAATDVQLTSVSGDLRAMGLRGALKAETVSGDVDIIGGPFSNLSAETVSGDVKLALSLSDAAEVSAETLSGNLSLRLPQAPDARLIMKTFSGDLSNRFDLSSDEDRRRYDRKLGNGKGSIKLNSFSGDIEVGPDTPLGKR